MQNLKSQFLRRLRRFYGRLPNWIQLPVMQLVTRISRGEHLGGILNSGKGRKSASLADFYGEFLKLLTSKKEYQQEIETQPIEMGVKAISFYLPQFHPFPENDKWWGKGFTEWTNVTKAIPQFKGHLQPRLPSDLGFYDLRQIETHQEQIRLARKYGVYGFCYYYYWFDGKRLMEKPLDLILNNESELNFPFCICWANENWSRRWDGNEDDVLIKQNYPEDYETSIISDIATIITDRRYIRIDGKPIIVVYRPSQLPSARRLSEKWREYCRKSGIGEIFLVSTHSFDRTDPKDIGFDATIEFAPNNMALNTVTNSVELYNLNFSGNIYDYRELVKLAKEYKKPNYLKFRGICPSWDNEPRKPSRGNVFIGSTPSSYSEWLEEICKFTIENMAPSERIVFINAWNEWAEGAFLEPDRYYGHSYLIKTYQILSKFGINKR